MSSEGETVVLAAQLDGPTSRQRWIFPALGFVCAFMICSFALLAFGVFESGSQDPRSLTVSAERVQDVSTSSEPAFVGANGKAFGPIPALEGNTVTRATYDAMPDFLSVSYRDGRDGVAGYMKKTDMFVLSGDRVIGKVGVFEVYDQTGETVVGRMMPGLGFVANGEDPSSIPNDVRIEQKTTGVGR